MSSNQFRHGTMMGVGKSSHGGLDNQSSREFVYDCPMITVILELISVDNRRQMSKLGILQPTLGDIFPHD